MKATFYSFLFSCFLLVGLHRSAAAQNIPNNNLETWAVRTGIEAPTNWLTTDDILFQQIAAYVTTPTNTGTVTKSTTAHGGQYAASLQTKSVTVLGQTATIPGILLLGNRVDPATLGGLPYTARPTQLQFYYKFTGPVADSAVAQVLLTTTNKTTNTAQLVGQAVLYLAPASAYTLATMPIQYGSSAQPDSVRLVFVSSTATKITAGTTVVIDDITLGTTALAVRADASFQEQLTVSPNPSSTGRFSVGSPAQPDLASAPLTVFDVTGRAVLRQPALATPATGRELDLSALPMGIYLLRLDSKQGTLVRQLVVK